MSSPLAIVVEYSYAILIHERSVDTSVGAEVADRNRA